MSDSNLSLRPARSFSPMSRPLLSSVSSPARSSKLSDKFYFHAHARVRGHARVRRARTIVFHMHVRLGMIRRMRVQGKNANAFSQALTHVRSLR